MRKTWLLPRHVVFLIATTLAVLSIPAAFSGDSSTAALVHDLSWQSVHGECWGLVWRIEPQGRTVKRLLHAGKSATEDLVGVLLDPERAVAAHLVLCRTWQRDAECATSSIPGSALSQPAAVVGQQLDINAITEPGPNEIVAEHHSGKVVWRTYGGGRSAVVQPTLEPNLGWWCDYFADHGLRITGACTR